MAQYVGKDIREVFISEGQPEAWFDLADGRRAYQWYWGGGTMIVPGSSHSTTTGYGSDGFFSASTTTIEHPPVASYSKGCLTTYIAARKDDAWIVEDIRYPDRLVC